MTAALDKQVNKIINRGTHSTHQQKRIQREISGVQNDAIEVAGSQDLSNYAKLDTTNAFTIAQKSAIATPDDGATITINLTSANVFSVTLGGNRTIDFTNAASVPGMHFTLILTQDATGSRTVTWDTLNDWAGGTAPTLTTTANAVDILTFVVDASGNIHGSLGIADSK